MPKFETGPSPEPTKEDVESLEKEQDVEKKPMETKELSPEEKREQIVNEIKTKQQEASRLAESNESTLKSLNEARLKLDLPPQR